MKLKRLSITRAIRRYCWWRRLSTFWKEWLKGDDKDT